MTKAQLEAIRRRDGVEYTTSVSEWMHDAKVDRRDLLAEVDRLTAENERLRQALADIAAFEDRYTASQEMRIARAALAQKP